MPSVSSLLRRLPRPALVFALALPLLWLRFGHWFYLSLDEGIYLEGARRVASGEVPYRDFFAITGPGNFWLYGLVFRCFGTSLAAARFLLCLELAATCAAIDCLVGRTATAAFAAAVSLLYLAMLLTTLYPVYITHRWDSNTCALLALCFIERRPRLAGIFAALAAWITPPLLLVAVALGFFTRLRPYLAGMGVVTAPALVLLAAQGALGPLIGSLVWDAARYSAANRLWWGALTLAFRSFQGPDLVHYADSILPAVLPPAAILLALPGEKRWLPLITSLAAAAACYPRFGAAQLLFASAFFWVLAAVSVPRRIQKPLAAAALAVAVGATAVAWPREKLKRIDTPAGTLQVSRRHFITLNDLLAVTKPGESVFVYPYLPSLYFALDVRNPTRYAWLQPGMMSEGDVRSAIESLRARPPRRVIWHDFTEAYILNNWPASDRARLRFPEMEGYLQTHYHVVIPDGVPTIGYKLMEKNP